MRYMHFNSSCSYAGLANILAFYGYETEDAEIALAIGLPYLLWYEEETKTYLAGAMLQSKEWFDLYLKPRGFQFQEKLVNAKEAVEQLQKGMMLGMQVSPQSKHAVVFLEKAEAHYIFLNNKKEASPEEERLILTQKELLERLPENVMLGLVERCARNEVDIGFYLEQSLLNWERLRQEIQEFVQRETEPQELGQAMNRLFRPLLVDALAMMELLEEKELAENLKLLQEDFLKAVRKKETVRLCEEFDCGRLDENIEKIKSLIKKKAEKGNTL